jgi:Na+-transporting NADH:ubiquinone oxidoreductase subunit A
MNIKTRKGFDINLVGKAALQVGTAEQSETFAIKPTEFVGMGRPKVVVREGDVVKAGTPLFFDKKLEKALYTSPVSGEVVEVKRGDKRKLLEIKILADKQIEYENFTKYSVSDMANLKGEDVKESLLKSGVWINIIQRPYGIVANPDETPRAIFISAFDSNPLAPDYDFLYKNEGQYFQAGIDALKKMVDVPIHLTTNGKAEVSTIFQNVRNVEQHTISGPHPAGNVGVQIHHIEPINRGEVVWTVSPYGIIQIGKLFLDGRYDASKKIAVVGSEVTTPQYYETYIGSNVSKFLKNNLKQDHVRVISGNILTGTAIEKDSYIGFYDNVVTVLPEGDRPRFFLSDGWLAPTSRLSFHRALGLLSFLNPKKERVIDTSLNGEERAFVETGVMEQVVPMDILPLQLVKSIMAEDYDGMESLGIYEVIEEDVALCEFVDVSKHRIQNIVRQGIQLLREG